MIDRTLVQRWLDSYTEAWRTYDPAQIGKLFSDDAEYRYHPLDEPVRGRDEIVRSWFAPEGNESSRDEPGTYDGKYAVWAIDGERAVAIGSSIYWTDASRSTIDRVYDNVFLLEFDAGGRCRSYTEVFEKRPESALEGTFA